MGWAKEKRQCAMAIAEISSALEMFLVLSRMFIDRLAELGH